MGSKGEKSSGAKSANALLIQSGVIIAMIFTALMLGDLIQPWSTEVTLSITHNGGDITSLYNISGVWLVLGSVTMAYLLFGWRALPAVFIGFHLAALYQYGWAINPYAISAKGNAQVWAWSNHMHALITTLGPLMAIYTMRAFKLSRFFEGGKLIFEHVIFLMILAAFYNTLAKFFIDTVFRPWIGLSVRGDEATYIPSMLVGDIIGGIGFVFVLALVVVPVIRIITPSTITET
jgi:hypothetical protein